MAHSISITVIPRMANAIHMSIQQRLKMNRILLSLSKRIVTAMACMYIMLIINPFRVLAQDVDPGELEFRRQAVRRLIFDRSQDIRLSGLWPAKAVGLDVMHPPVGPQINNPRLAIEDGRLQISAQKAGVATRWIGGFNPFAVYDVAVDKFNGSGTIGLIFRDTDAEIGSRQRW